jgi:hypothetical protein
MKFAALRPSARPGDVAMLEVRLIDRARKGWDWQVRDEAGTVILRGRQKIRLAAKYYGERALFQLLATGWKSDESQAL